MAAARFWRLVSVFVPGGGDLHLSEIALHGTGGRIDASAAMTSSHAPSFGTLVNLSDDDATTSCGFAGSEVRSSGFWIEWDFGVSTEITGLQLRSVFASGFPSNFLLQRLDASGVWDVHSTLMGLLYPGDAVYTELIAAPATSWNPADAGAGITLSNGNLTASANGSNAVRSIFGASSGKWYWEVTFANDQYFYVGVATSTRPISGGNQFLYAAADQWTLRAVAGQKNGPGVNTGYAGVPASGTSVGVKLDMDAGTIGFVVNGVDYGTAFSGLVGPLHAIVSGGDFPKNNLTANFGGSAFAYPVPAGYAPGFGQGGMRLPEVGPSRVNVVQVGAATSCSASLDAFSTVRDIAHTARDIEFGGPGTVYGTTKTKGTPNVPTKARVVLAHQRSKLPVRETWSDPVTGAFVFSGIDTNQQFLTLAEDAAGHFRPVAANRLTPEVL